MPEELSPESKLYVKEEIENVRKEIREDVEKVKSKATKTFTTVVIVVGLFTGLGVYGLAVSYIDTAIKQGLEDKGITELKSKAEGLVKQAEGHVKQIEGHETQAQQSTSRVADIENILSNKMIVGTIVPYGGEIVETTPGDPCQVREGWFFCNGAGLDRKEYEELFDVIGEAFGEPDDDTFNLPDLRGRVTVGAGAGEDLTPRTLGEKDGGEEKHILTIDEMPKHKHRWKDVRADRNDDYGFSGSESNVHRIIPSKGDIPGKHFIDDISQEEGKDKPHNNMQPFLVVNYIIKAR
jgi:microcystin-dependent protein